VPSVLWHSWAPWRALAHKKMSDEVLVWLSLWREVQIVCIWSSWCHRHTQTPSSLTSFKSRLVLPFWYQLTHVVLQKRPLNGCSYYVFVRFVFVNQVEVVLYNHVSRKVVNEFHEILELILIDSLMLLYPMYSSKYHISRWDLLGLKNPKSRITGVEKPVQDCNPYLWHQWSQKWLNRLWCSTIFASLVSQVWCCRGPGNH